MHTGGRGMKFKKLGHKNAIKHENRTHPIDFMETCFGNDQRKKNKEKLYKVESKKIRHI
jgi:hypothetical protein